MNKRRGRALRRLAVFCALVLALSAACAGCAGAAPVTHLAVPEGTQVIEAGRYSALAELESVDIPASVVSIEEGAFPRDRPIVLYGWENHASGRYAAAHGNVTLRLKNLRVLCVGNSHTVDYTAFLPVMLGDLAPYLNTGISFTTAPMMGGRHLCYSQAKGEEYDPGSYLEIWQTPDHPEHAAYRELFARGWDLILIQDWHESTSTPWWEFPGGSAYAAVLGQAVALVREMAPGARVAWFADWVDSENDNERRVLYQDSVDAMAAAAALPPGAAPDFILPASTVLSNARTSYLGKTRNPADVIAGGGSFSDYAGEEVGLYPLLSRDETHLSLELGRYLIGEAVLAHILAWYDGALWLSEEGAAAGGASRLTGLLHTDPVWEEDGASWQGEMTPELREICLEAVLSSLQEPLRITEASPRFREDPLDGILASMGAYLSGLGLSAGMPDETILKCCREPAVLAKLSEILGAPVGEDRIQVLRGDDGSALVFVLCHSGYSFAGKPVLTLPAP